MITIANEKKKRDDSQGVWFFCNITADAELKQAKKRELDYTLFRVGMSRRGKSLFVDVVIFGERAKGLTPYLTKGRRIFIDGEMDANDKGRFNSIIADEIEFIGGPRDKEHKKT